MSMRSRRASSVQIEINSSPVTLDYEWTSSDSSVSRSTTSPLLSPRTNLPDYSEHEKVALQNTRRRSSNRAFLGAGLRRGRRSFFLSPTFIMSFIFGTALTLLFVLVNQSWLISNASEMKPKRVFIRQAGNAEGIGSALQRMKGGIIISQLLEATWLLGETPSEHAYLHDDYLNPSAFNEGRLTFPQGRICRLTDYLSREERNSVIRGTCFKHGNDYEKALELKKKIEDRQCAIIIEDVIWDEVYEDLNGCYRNFVRERLGGLQGRRSVVRDPAGDQAALTLGIHIRWGDAALFESTMEAPRGSMQLANINEIVATVRNRFKRLDIRVVMESANSTVLDLLDFKDYTLVDSGEALSDLHGLGDNDLVMLGGSSYGALAHLIAPPQGLTIVEGIDWAGKYADSIYRPVLLNAGRDSDFVWRLEQMFPEIETF